MVKGVVKGKGGRRGRMNDDDDDDEALRLQLQLQLCDSPGIWFAKACGETAKQRKSNPKLIRGSVWPLLGAMPFLRLEHRNRLGLLLN